MSLEAIKYEPRKLTILDQTLLPLKTEYITINSVQDAWDAIRHMKVRGAPAIAIVGCLSLAVELRTKDLSCKDYVRQHVVEQMEYLITSRPTAVNLQNATNHICGLAASLVKQNDVDVNAMKGSILQELESMLKVDIALNKSIGEHGAQHIIDNCGVKPVCILTHCNTGSLATAGYGTALGVIRSLHLKSLLEHVYCTETRPYNQGARLTAYELVYEKIPSTLVCDDMVAWLMKTKRISAVVVGADRVAANGDTANKIGTYQLAVIAKHHGVPFYVAAPTTSIDFTCLNGDAIPIEERSYNEVTHIQGIQIAASGIGCWNPAFDVTPADLITGGIITEHGVFPSRDLSNVCTFMDKA